MRKKHVSIWNRLEQKNPSRSRIFDQVWSFRGCSRVFVSCVHLMACKQNWCELELFQGFAFNDHSFFECLLHT